MNKSLDNFFVGFKEEIQDLKSDMDRGFSSLEKNLSSVENHVSNIETTAYKLQKFSNRFSDFISNAIFLILGILIVFILNKI